MGKLRLRGLFLLVDLDCGRTRGKYRHINAARTRPQELQDIQVLCDLGEKLARNCRSNHFVTRQHL